MLSLNMQIEHFPLAKEPLSVRDERYLDNSLRKLSSEIQLPFPDRIDARFPLMLCDGPSLDSIGFSDEVKLMAMTLEISQLNADAARNEALIFSLVGILRDSIDNGFSVGFLHKDTNESLKTFWENEIAKISAGNRILIATRDQSPVGVVIITPELRSNGSHRGELRKLMVKSSEQRSGIGSALEYAACQVAREMGLSLLYLDSATDYLVNKKYEEWGWKKVGSIPRYAATPDGKLVATTFFYKELTD